MYTHGEAERNMNGGKCPLQDDHSKHDPWNLALFLDENVTADPAERKVNAWIVPGK